MPHLLCTVRTCHQPLGREPGRLICPGGHSFDIARSGYINLLQPQDRRAAVPGDRAEAVAARRRFLDRGYAEPLLGAIRELTSGATILDAGCGEGYYLGSIGRGCGVDISTAAIDLAARRYPACEWVVANADRFVPYSDASFDVIVSVTGRLNATEFRRVIKDDGTLIVAVPSPDDLVELRGRRNRDRVPRTIEMFAPQFALVDQRRVTTRADLDAESVRDILAATYRPARVRGPASAGPDRLKPVATQVTLSFDLLRFLTSPSPTRRSPRAA